ncbi:MAG TPA: hypothetical protein VK511_12500 [Gemmatimonadaceae bacterium]|nr:hypothetical protein [Gemmatimonadaceae bacterium]
MRLASTLRSTFVALTTVLAVACADTATPLAPHVAEPAVSFSKGRDGKNVAVCKLQKEEWKTEQIGPRGGHFNVGGVTLTIPAHALTRTVAITAHTLPTTSASVQLLPEGLQFAVPATLTMNYMKCQTPLLGVNVVYVQADTVAEVVPSKNHPLLKLVSASIRHFSSYAVAY